MPEFGDVIGFLEQVRMGAITKTPRELAQAFRTYRATEYDAQKEAQMLKLMFEVITEVQGMMAAAEFMQEANR
jgi:hypothetical protein